MMFVEQAPLRKIKEAEMQMPSTRLLQAFGTQSALPFLYILIFSGKWSHWFLTPLLRVSSTLTKAAPHDRAQRGFHRRRHGAGVTIAAVIGCRLAPSGDSSQSARSHACFPARPAASLPLRRPVPERAAQRQLGAPLPR